MRKCLGYFLSIVQIFAFLFTFVVRYQNSQVATRSFIPAGNPGRDAGVAHALTHGATGHAHAGGHVRGPHRGHGGPHGMMWRVQRLHWGPVINA